MELLTTMLQRALCVRLCLLVTLWIAVSGGMVARAEPSAPTTPQVQAAFLFNFAKFVTWPNEAFQRSGDTLIIGVLGEDPFGVILEDTIRDKTVMGKKLAVKRFASIQDAAHSHILFLSTSEEGRLSHMMTALEKTNILTVSDMEQFAEHGGMVAFTVEDQKVRFNINVGAVERAGLKMGSQLLKLARIVSDKPRTGN
jgi:uncharacterized protein DUF4154